MNIRAVAFLSVILLGLLRAMAAPLGTSFTYQGRLTDNGQPANGNYDLKLDLYDAASGGTHIAGPITNLNVAVVNGMFSTELDFGSGVFQGTACWLDLAVRPAGTASDPFTPLTPRQPIGATPHALFAPTAGQADTVADRSITGDSIRSAAITADKVAVGQLVTSVNGLRDDVSLAAGANVTLAVDGNTVTISSSGGAGGGGWSLTGNAGTTPGVNFLGTTDAQSLELRVMGRPAFRLEPMGMAVNVIGGSYNTVMGTSVWGATIAGGGGGEVENRVMASWATIGGGARNLIRENSANASIAGGSQNTIGPGAQGATISGGIGQTIRDNAGSAWIGGGEGNSIMTKSQASVVAGGAGNQLGPNASYAGIVGGYNNRIGLWATEGFIGGGLNNTIGEGAANSVIGGGAGNEVGQDAWEAFIGSGEHNRIQADARFGVIPGGQSNLVAGRYAFAAGNRAQALHEGSFVWADATDADFSSTAANQVSVRATGGVRLETGGAGLQIDGRGVGETVTSWQVAPSGTVQAEAGRAYLLLYNDQVLILPANPATGEVVRVAGRGLTWRIRQQEGQRIMWSPGLQPNQEWIAVGQSRPWTGVAMSADGAQMLAGAWAGDLYISRDSGATWAGTAQGPANWYGVASSSDGTHLAACNYGGQIHLSVDSGETWYDVAVIGDWRSIAMSENGSRLVACTSPVGSPGRLYVSDDAGVTWNPRGPEQDWVAVASSANGSNLVAVTSSRDPMGDSFVYGSEDGGQTWVERDRASIFWNSVASSSAGNSLIAGAWHGGVYTSKSGGEYWELREGVEGLDWQVASSSDGTRLLAGAYGGQLFISADTGRTWTAQEGRRDWQAVASSADGAVLAACVRDGEIHVWRAIPTWGSEGGLTAKGRSAIELVHAGAGEFLVVSHEGYFSAY